MDLFGRLLKLHSGAVPLEDFFTEVVAHLFEAEPQTCLAWIGHAGLLTEKERHGVRVTTQQSLDAIEHHATGSRDFLPGEDHVAEIKKFFLESLEELREIKEQHPHLPWGGST